MANTNTYQVLLRIKAILQAAVWGATTNVVFNENSVRVCVINPTTTAVMVKTVILPMVMIGVGAARTDPEYGEEPGLIEREITIRIIAIGYDGGFGEAAIAGSNIADTTKSEGRGLLESLEKEVLDAVEYLKKSDTVHLEYVSEGIRDVVVDGKMRGIGYVDHHFVLLTTTDAG